MKKTMIATISAATLVLAGCGGGFGAQFPGNAAIWEFLGGESAASLAAKKIVNDVIAKQPSASKVSKYFGTVASEQGLDTTVAKACLYLQMETALGGPTSYPDDVLLQGKSYSCSSLMKKSYDTGVVGCIFRQIAVDTPATLKAYAIPDFLVKKVASALEYTNFTDMKLCK